MATGSTSPTARRFELARRLRELRLAADRSVEEVAAELMCSPAKISRLETAGRAIQPRDVRDLCRFYGVSRAVQEDLMQLTADAGERGWWQDYRALDEQAKTYVGLESAAAEMLEFETLRMPGLLQTPEYTSSWIERMRPPDFWRPGDIEEIVEVRARRQKRVIDGSIRLHAILDKAAFDRIVGSRRIMVAQVEKLVEWARLENVELQVIPFEAGPHPGLDGSYMHLRFHEGLLNEIVLIEGQFGNQILDKEDVVVRYRDVHHNLSALAMTELETIRWLQAYKLELISTAEVTEASD